jgi:ubiquinone/menaquinone biosynthesis C-methylase UbiE
VTDWRSYEAIADAYDQRWLARFEEAARRLLAFAGADHATRLLDLGTGTGAVLAALGARRKTMARVVGCDLSFSMVSRARRHAPMSPVVATVTRLPFHEGTFDLVTGTSSCPMCMTTVACWARAGGC